MLRVQLINDLLGVLTIKETDPGGLDGFEQTIRRSKESDGLFKDFSLQLDFNQEAREWIRDIFEATGIDSIIICNVYEYDVNTDTWEIYYTGQLNMRNYQINETAIKLNVEQGGVERKFLQLYKNDVDLDSVVSQNQVTTLQAAPSITLPFHSKTILKESNVFPAEDIFDNDNWSSSTEYFIGDRVNYMGAAWDSRTDNNLNNLPPTPPNVENTNWAYVWNEQTDSVFDFEFTGSSQVNRNADLIGQVSTDDESVRELQDTFSLPFGFSLDPDPTNFVELQEPGVFDIDASMHLRHYFNAVRDGNDVDVNGCGNSELGNITVEAWFEHRNRKDTVKTKTSLGTWTMPPCGDNTVFSNFEQKTYQATGVVGEIGDKIYFYYAINISGTYDPSGNATITHNLGVEAILEDTYIDIKQSTTFPSTTAKSILIYEYLDKLCQYYMDSEVAFVSDFFGRTDTSPAYAEDGEGALLAITNGRILRQLSDLTIFANFDEAFRTLDSIFCLGWGFETLDSGETVIRIEKKEYFYDKNTTLLKLGQVSNLKKSNVSGYFKTTQTVGYQKIEKIAQTNAVDEFNAPRKYTSPIVNSTGNNENKALYRASGFEIESQRRLAESTEESRLDDSNFIVVVRRDAAAPDGFRTDQNEDFDFINGIFDPTTVYNAKISPSRNFRRWGKVLAADVIKNSDKKFRFSLGELNYNMSSQLTSENITIFEYDDIDFEGEEPLYYNEEYEFETELRLNEMRIIRYNPNAVIEFLDWYGYTCEGFINEVTDNRNTNKAKMKLRRVFRGT